VPWILCVLLFLSGTPRPLRGRHDFLHLRPCLRPCDLNVSRPFHGQIDTDHGLPANSPMDSGGLPSCPETCNRSVLPYLRLLSCLRPSVLHVPRPFHGQLTPNVAYKEKVSVSLVVFIATSREQAEIETLSVGLLANLDDGPSLSVGLRLTCSAAALHLHTVPTFTSRGTAQERCGFREGRDGDRAGRPCGVWSRTRAVLAILQHLFGRTGACRRAYRFCSSDCNTHLLRYT
jgi:hypothetical protein